MSISNEQVLNKMDPLREKKQKLFLRDQVGAWALIYEWVKADVISQSEFRKLTCYLIGIWSI